MAIMVFGQVATQGFQNPGYVIANQVIIIGSNGELLVYNPSEGPGNLVASIVAQNGPDSFSNPVLAGVASYGNAVSPEVASVLDGGSVQWWSDVATGTLFAAEGINTTDIGIPILSQVLFDGPWEIRGESDVNALMVVPPSGDTTGNTDSTWLSHCLIAGYCVKLLPGTYYIDGTADIGLGQYISGAGMSATTVKLVSIAGAVPAFKLINTGAYSVESFAGLRDLTVDLTGANAGASAVQAGDILQVNITDVAVHGNSTITAPGAYFVNNLYQTEQANVRMYFAGLTNPVQFDVQGSGSTSYDRGSFEFFIDQFNANGNGVAWTNGALQRGGSLKIRGNFSGGVTNTGVVLAFSGAGASLTRVNFDVSVEADGSGTGPQTINFALGSNTIDGYGSADFLSSGGAFQASNNNGQFELTGRVSGDTTLQREVGAGTYSFITTGFPAGWSGRIGFEKMDMQDQVFVTFELTIAATTVVTTGEAIITGLATLYEPIVGQYFCVVQEFNGVFTTQPIQITTAGSVLYQGPGFTAAGVSALHGSAVYSNSQ
jgi:hypothetical protein